MSWAAALGFAEDWEDTHSHSQCSSAWGRSFGSHRREVLAALPGGCVLSLQSQRGQRRCNLVNPAQRTEDLILCPYVPLVIKQLLLLTQGNMFFMVPGYRTKKKSHHFSIKLVSKCSNFYLGAICFSLTKSKVLPAFHHFWAWRAAYQKIKSVADT